MSTEATSAESFFVHTSIKSSSLLCTTVRLPRSSADRASDSFASVGRIAEGLSADVVVLRGDASHDIAAVRDVELLFKGGIAYDPEELVASVAGRLGERTRSANGSLGR